MVESDVGWRIPETLNRTTTPVTTLRSLTTRLVLDPLPLCLLAGFLLFVAWDALAPPQPDARSLITIDDTALANLLAHRHPDWSRATVAATLAGLSRATRTRLVDDLIREEILYREGLALGLLDDDYAARRRVITRFENLQRGFVAEREGADVVALDAWRNEHASRFTLPARTTFTHVFIAPGADPERPMRTRDRLNREDARFADAGRYGDAYPGRRNLVDRDLPDIAREFGDAFADTLFGLSALDEWQGPIHSQHGLHLVLVTRQTPERLPALDEIRDEVAADLVSTRHREAMARFVDAARDRYTIIEAP